MKPLALLAWPLALVSVHGSRPDSVWNSWATPGASAGFGETRVPNDAGGSLCSEEILAVETQVESGVPEAVNSVTGSNYEMEIESSDCKRDGFGTGGDVDQPQEDRLELGSCLLGHKGRFYFAVSVSTRISLPFKGWKATTEAYFQEYNGTEISLEEEAQKKARVMDLANFLLSEEGYDDLWRLDNFFQGKTNCIQPPTFSRVWRVHRLHVVVLTLEGTRIYACQHK